MKKIKYYILILIIISINIFQLNNTYAIEKSNISNLLSNFYNKLDNKYSLKEDKIKVLTSINNKLNKILEKKDLEKKELYIMIQNNILNKLLEYKENISLINDLSVLIISDKRCKECPPLDIIVNSFKQDESLKNATFVIQDYSDIWVKETLKNKWVKYLPFVWFSKKNINEDFDRYLVTLKDWTFSLTIWSQFDPSLEICDNSIDDTNNWKIDCDDSDCKSSLVCRKEKKAQVEVFLMGYCPFGELAAKTLPDLRKHFWKELDIKIHYIVSKNSTWYSINDFYSLHGSAEVEENMRQLCITKHYWIDKTIEYMQTRYKNANNYWEVSEDKKISYDENKIDDKKIDDCVTNWEAWKILEEDMKIASSLNISWSPTWLANNKYSFAWFDTNIIKNEICKYNKEINVCKDNKKLDNSSSSKQNTWVSPTCK